MTLPIIMNRSEGQLVLPDGWTTATNDKLDQYITLANTSDFMDEVSKTLQEATDRVEELISTLYRELDLYVSVAYLTVNPDASYHVYLLVNQEDYHSTHIIAANLLAEKFTESSEDISMRFTFTVKREHIMSYLTTNSYKFKYTFRPPGERA